MSEHKELYCAENWSHLTTDAYFKAEDDMFCRVISRVDGQLDDIFKCQKGDWNYDTPREMAEFLLADYVLGMSLEGFDHMFYLDCLNERLKANPDFDVCSYLSEGMVGEIADDLLKVGLQIDGPYN